jgi:serine/threonine protein kinase
MAQNLLWVSVLWQAEPLLAELPPEPAALRGEVRVMSTPTNAGMVAGLEPPLEAGTVLGRYELLEVLGQGSMGHVYLARHTLLGRLMALKVLRTHCASDVELVGRFFEEARAANQINHEHIVQVFDFVQDPPVDARPGCVYCVMEPLAGESLMSRIATGAMPVADVVCMALQVCAALEAAHRVGVIHRDIKPDNLFITERDGRLFTKVLDFGVAKLTRSLVQSQPSTTLAGTIIGTPTYMSPEQASGSELDLRSDIYSLGTVLYEALAGVPPFSAPTLGLLLVQIITEQPPMLPRYTPGGEPIPAALAAIVHRCLAKRPDARPQSMADLAREVTSGWAPPPIPVRPRGRSRLLGGATLAGVVIGAFGARLGTLLTSPRFGESSKRAPVEETRRETPLPPAAPLRLEFALATVPAAPESAPAESHPSHRPEWTARPVQATPDRARKAVSHDADIDPFAP